MKEMTDIELFLLVKSKNKEALEVLYDRYIKLLYSFVHKMCPDDQLTKDILQKIFIRLWTTESHYDATRGLFTSWLFTVARNITIDVIRSERKHLLAAIDIDDRVTIKEDDSNNPEMRLLQSLKREEIHKSLKHLSQEQRSIITLTYWKGYTLSETAKLLNIPLGTVKSRLHQALKNLRYHFQQEEEVL